jgi:hypothetical protein
VVVTSALKARLLALSLGALSFGILAPASAWAEDDDDDGGGDGGDGGEASETGDEPDDPKDQPPVTAGGLFTLKSYPVRELFRPLTMTQKITQMRLDLGTDVSDKTAFEFFGVSVSARHGLQDNFTLLGGFASDYNFKGFAFTFGFEGGIAYDMFDIRLAANLNRTAQPVFMDFGDAGLLPIDFKAANSVQFSVDLGFPFRYVARPEIAIVALETLIQFDFNAVRQGNGGISCLGQGQPGFDPNNCDQDGIKPDLAPSIGITSNPIAQLNLTLFAQLQIRDFDTSNQFTVPATARVTFSPNQKLDIGLEFKFLDLKPKDLDGDGPAVAPSPVAQRFMNMFVQARY